LATAKRLVLDSVEHGVTLTRVGTVRPTLGLLAAADVVSGRSPSDQRGTCSLWRRTSPHNLVFGGACKALDHDAVMRIGGRFRAAAPIYKSGTKARVGIGAPPPRIVWAAASERVRQAPSLRSHKAPWLMGQGFDKQAVQIATGFSTTPAGSSPVVTKRHSATRILRASATIIFLRVSPRPSAVRS
jgi:hypothetical protein